MAHPVPRISISGKVQLLNSEAAPAFSGQNESASGETHFADLFETYIAQSGPKRCIPKFAALYREVPATVGVADFVGLVAPRWRHAQQRLTQRLHGLPRAPVAEVLAHLDYRQHTTKDELFRASHFSRPVVSMAAAALVKAGVVANVLGKGYVLRPHFKLPEAEIHFYEIKLEKWSRALFQASQALSYADKAYCVMPASKKQVLLENRELFRNAGVGVILFDAAQWQVVELIAGRKAKPKRPADKIDVLMRLAIAKAC